MPGTDAMWGCPSALSLTRPMSGRPRREALMATGVPVSELDRNLILAPLPLAERARIAERAEAYESYHEVLVQPGGTIEHAYCPSRGVISVVAALRNGRRAGGTAASQGGTAQHPLLPHPAHQPQPYGPQDACHQSRSTRPS